MLVIDQVVHTLHKHLREILTLTLALNSSILKFGIWKYEDRIEQIFVTKNRLRKCAMSKYSISKADFYKHLELPHNLKESTYWRAVCFVDNPGSS